MSGLAAAAAVGGVARKVQAAVATYLSARQAFVNEIDLLLQRDDPGRVIAEALLQRDVAPLLCCPLVSDASPGVRATALHALAKLSAAAPAVAEALLGSGVVDAVVAGLGAAGAGTAAVQVAANAALRALAGAGGSAGARIIMAAGEIDL